jgi:hypothetical protein
MSTFNHARPIKCFTAGGYKIRHLTFEADRGDIPFRGEVFCSGDKWTLLAWGYDGAVVGKNVTPKDSPYNLVNASLAGQRSENPVFLFNKQPRPLTIQPFKPLPKTRVQHPTAVRVEELEKEHKLQAQRNEVYEGRLNAISKHLVEIDKELDKLKHPVLAESPREIVGAKYVEIAAASRTSPNFKKQKFIAIKHEGSVSLVSDGGEHYHLTHGSGTTPEDRAKMSGFVIDGWSKTIIETSFSNCE